MSDKPWREYAFEPATEPDVYKLAAHLMDVAHPDNDAQEEDKISQMAELLHQFRESVTSWRIRELQREMAEREREISDLRTGGGVAP